MKTVILTSNNKPDIERILLSNTKYQGTVDFSTFRNRLLPYMMSRLDNPDVTMFGYEQDGQIVGILDTHIWDNRVEFTLQTSSVDQNIKLPLVENSRWPVAIIEMVNAAVEYYRDCQVAWTIRPNNPKWVPYAAVEGCILKNMKSEIVATIPANTVFPKEYQQVVVGPIPVENHIIKIFVK